MVTVLNQKYKFRELLLDRERGPMIVTTIQYKRFLNYDGGPFWYDVTPFNPNMRNCYSRTPYTVFSQYMYTPPPVSRSWQQQQQPDITTKTSEADDKERDHVDADTLWYNLNSNEDGFIGGYIPEEFEENDEFAETDTADENVHITDDEENYFVSFFDFH